MATYILKTNYRDIKIGFKCSFLSALSQDAFNEAPPNSFHCESFYGVSNVFLARSSVGVVLAPSQVMGDNNCSSWLASGEDSRIRTRSLRRNSSTPIAVCGTKPTGLTWTMRTCTMSHEQLTSRFHETQTPPLTPNP